MIDMTKIEEFVLAAAQKLSLHKSNIAAQLAETLATVELRFAIDTADLSPLVPDMPKSLAQNDGDLGRMVATLAPNLWWRPPGFGKAAGTVASNIAVVEVIGPNGMVLDKRCRFGLLLQDKNTVYPKHSHAAEELYFILSGTAKWVVDDGVPQTRSAESFIHHLPFQSHAMTTKKEAMLTMWGWVGDISASSYSMPKSG